MCVYTFLYELKAFLMVFFDAESICDISKVAKMVFLILC